MPKKKMIPPPDDFSSEFMETESAKELSEQQVEAAGSDNTETPLAEPPEVDLGSGDVSGTTDVEENELDAENTADAAETVPVSDEKAEDPEYDSILQELNSSTPAPLDSSGENALDALLLEENVENAPPAEDETESADGEAAPQPTAPPAPAGRRDSYILTVDAKDRIKAGPMPAACHVADGQRLCRSGSRFIGSGKPERPAAACKNLHAFPGG